MERFGLFLVSELANSFCLWGWRATSPRGICGVVRIRIEACRRILCGRGRAIIFCAHSFRLASTLGAVFGSQDVGMLEIFFGVNMLGALFVIPVCVAFLSGRLRRRFDLVGLVRVKRWRRESRSSKKEWPVQRNGWDAKFSLSLCDAAGGAWGRLGQSSA